MSEPVSVGMGALVKAYGLGVLIGLFIVFAWLVVVMTRMPRTRSEWVVGLITTVVASLFGGSLLIVKFGLHEWGNNIFGMMTLGGFYFACGLPGWAIVRWTFNFINKREGADLIDVVREVKNEIQR